MWSSVESDWCAHVASWNITFKALKKQEKYARFTRDGRSVDVFFRHPRQEVAGTTRKHVLSVRKKPCVGYRYETPTNKGKRDMEQMHQQLRMDFKHRNNQYATSALAFLFYPMLICKRSFCFSGRLLFLRNFSKNTIEMRTLKKFLHRMPTKKDTQGMLNHSAWKLVGGCAEDGTGTFQMIYEALIRGTPSMNKPLCKATRKLRVSIVKVETANSVCNHSTRASHCVSTQHVQTIPELINQRVWYAEHTTCAMHNCQTYKCKTHIGKTHKGAKHARYMKLERLKRTKR